jgi:hypothetical protein
MNMRTASFALLALSAASFSACAGGGSQEAPAPEPDPFVTRVMLEPPPIYAIIGYRRELDLTSEQVSALDSVAQSVQERNRPLVQQLMAASRERPRQPGTLEVSVAGESVLEQIRGNQREASESVESLLTDDQKASVCRLFDPAERRGTAERRPQERGRGRDSRRAARARPAVWHWCGETPTEPPPN